MAHKKKKPAYRKSVQRVKAEMRAAHEYAMRKRNKRRGSKKKSSYRKSANMLRRRWPGFKAKRPTGAHFEVLHQAWSDGRGKWYVMGFSPSLAASKKLAMGTGRPGEFAIRKIVGGRPLRKIWKATAIRTRGYASR